MPNDREVQFTPAAGSNAGIEFTPAAGLEAGNPGNSSSMDAGQMASEAKNQAQQAAGTAQEKLQQAAGTAQEKVQQRVQSQIDAQKARAAETLGSVAQSLRSSGQQLQGQQQDGVSRIMQQAADRVERVADYIENADVGELMHQAEDFARRQPALFVGGAFALGVLGARFLKSSKDNLIRDELYETRNTRTLTSRVDNPERDAVGRPNAPGYEPPSDRTGDSYKAAGPRDR